MRNEFNKQKGQKVIIREKSEIKFIDMEFITHLSCEGYLTTLHTIDSTNFIVTKLLKEFEYELTDFGFIRVNRSTIVNMAHVSKISNKGKRLIELANNEIVPISRRRMFLFRNN